MHASGLAQASRGLQTSLRSWLTSVVLRWGLLLPLAAQEPKREPSGEVHFALHITIWTASPDGLVYEFQRRLGLTFHNGALSRKVSIFSAATRDASCARVNCDGRLTEP